MAFFTLFHFSTMINATATVPDQKQTWKSIWPIKILKLIAAIQIIATLGTLGTEAGSVAIHPFLATVYSGFYCSIFFTLAWVSIFTVSKSSSIDNKTIVRLFFLASFSML